MTTGLYYEDSHLKSFTATVLSCTPGKHGYDVILDRTAFYPEGGGQPGDRGTLGGVPVTDTHTKDGVIVHYCALPLEAGDLVEGILDWDYRFHLMQNHSGEHVLSGLIHKAYGYDNVGFHMGADAVTIDFNGVLTEEQLIDLEQAANAYIWQNREVKTCCPDEATLAQLPYRSKKALSGQVRLVEFPEADLCACCGVHVKRTGEIGFIKILSCQKFREGVRMEILCGKAALEYLNMSFQENRKVSQLLSAKQTETGAAAKRLCDELTAARYQVAQLQEAHFAQIAQGYAGKQDVLHFEPALGPDGVRRLADAISGVSLGTTKVFSVNEEQCHYAVTDKTRDIRPLVKAMNEALDGRGGGKPNFCQGSVRAQERAIRAYFL